MVDGKEKRCVNVLSGKWLRNDVLSTKEKISLSVLLFTFLYLAPLVSNNIYSTYKIECSSPRK